jgi:hypothetical protein
LILTFLAIGAVIWTGSTVLPRYYEQLTRHDLEVRARLVEPQSAVFDLGDLSACDAICKELGKRSDTLLR